MSICAPKPFGSKFLKGGYSYWPLWWYGQKSKLHDMSGHGVDLTPSGAYFDGQGYYFDGSDDYLIDVYGRKILENGTEGSWHSVYLTEGAVPVEGSIRGTGTKIYFNKSGVAPKITGKIVLRPESCPNLTFFWCMKNSLSTLKVDGLTYLTYLHFYSNNISTIDVSTLSSLEFMNCSQNPLPTLDISGATSLEELHCYECPQLTAFSVPLQVPLELLWCFSNNMSNLDVSGVTSLTYLRCENNSMDQDMVDTVLCDMDSHGTSNGILKIFGNAAPSATGVACKDNLVSRGWTVATD